MTQEFTETMERVATAIRAAGYDLYSQLYGYIKTGDPAYITRSGGARELIEQLDREQVRQYMETVLENSVNSEEGAGR